MAADAGLPGTITSSTFQGSTTLIGVRLDVLDSLVTVDVGHELTIDHAVGARIGVEVNGARAVCEPVAAAA